jgi:autotransporter family porin
VWLAGRIIALLAIVVAGTLAIVHYSTVGGAIADRPEHPSMAIRGDTEPVPPATAAVGQAPRPERPSADPPSSSSPPLTASSPATTSAPDPQPSRSAKALSTQSPSPTASSPIHFRTLPPGAVLPTGAECARWVRESPDQEIRPGNTRDNRTIGQHVGPHFFLAGDLPQAGKRLAPRINGRFTGTTEEILRWAACKWGISQNVVFAQTALESWWRQGTVGDWGTDAGACPPGHKPGADGMPGVCPQSYGIMQNRYPLEKGAWPGIGDSTAMSADAAYAIWRSCYDGDEVWLNSVTHVGRYHRGDLWACVGRWFAGRWNTAAAQVYIARVRRYLRERIWLTRRFQPPPPVSIPLAGRRQVLMAR